MEHHRTRSLWHYYAITKWNYYLQGSDIIVQNDHKPLNKFLNGKNVNSKVNRWGLEFATYNITFEWISGACNKAANCLSCLVELSQDKPVSINILSTYYLSQTQMYLPSIPEVKSINAYLQTLPPQSQILPQMFRSKRSYTKIPDSRQVKSSPADAEN